MNAGVPGASCFLGIIQYGLYINLFGVYAFLGHPKQPKGTFTLK